MLPKHLTDKLGYFDPEKYMIGHQNEDIILGEKNKDGKAKLTCHLNNDALILPSPEKNVLRYLDEKIKGATACADVFLFEMNPDDKWILHIMEFKKSIDTSTMSKSKKQFTMGIYNARAVAGFLNIKIEDIFLYSGYRNDKITSLPEDNLSKMRSSNNLEILRLINEWNKGKWSLEVDLKKKFYVHTKVKLDENGNGQYMI